MARKKLLSDEIHDKANQWGWRVKRGLGQTIGPADLKRLMQWADSVRELERRVSERMSVGADG